MRVRITHVLLAATILLVTGATANAQRARAGEGRGANADTLGPAQILNMLDAWALVQAQDTLQLRDDQYGEFVARLKRLQQTRRRGLQERLRILQDLRRLTAPDAVADDAAIRERLKSLADHDSSAAAAMRKAYEELDQVLSPRQQARFRLFEDVLERRKIDLLKRAQQGAAARGRRQ
jgi:Spy/CpxP family protein refolding chaperone